MSRRSDSRDRTRQRDRRDYSRSRSPSRGYRRSRSRDPPPSNRRWRQDDDDDRRSTRDVDGNWREQPRMSQDGDNYYRPPPPSQHRSQSSHSSHDQRRPYDRDDASSHDHQRRPYDRDEGPSKPSPVHIEPCSTLMIKGLPFSTTNAELMNILGSFGPTGGRIIVNKATGESRGFAFIDFASIESAKYVVQYFAKQPLTIQGRVIGIGYSEPARSQHFHAPPPRCDWLCPMCNATNFSKRVECYKCGNPKTDFAVEVPRAPVGEFNNLTVPSHILSVRSLPLEAEEADLTQMFQHCPGLTMVRMARDRTSNVSKGFGFVEFASVEYAADALATVGTEFYYANALVRVSYAVDSGHASGLRVLGPSFTRTRRSLANSLVVGGATAQALAQAALEAAQWSVSHTMSAPQPTDLDVNALLASAAAGVTTTPNAPRKEFPLSFEEAGGSFVFVSDNGLYYDTTSMFYYDPTSKIYYNSYMGTYFTYNNATFEPYDPPLPVDDRVAAALVPSKDASNKASKKKAAISFGIKPVSKTTPLSATPLVNTLPVPSMAAPAATVAVKKKHADEIAKWSQQQKTDPSAAAAATPSTDQVSMDAGPAICLLCRRKFNSTAQLRKHEQLSDLHKQNLAKAKQTKDSLRVKETVDVTPQAYVHVPPPVPVDAARVDKPLDDQANIGGKMLKSMGWKSGEGLGKKGTGITAPVTAVGKTSGDTSGLGGNPLASNPAVQTASSKREKINQITRARFEGLQD
ncbi:Aste57867_16276 [Aphanomyces stellatus]|uniref:Aste57867_16276 protein n=1 Tax=Aphanomyces stellatus TaxID=120398 RepID=A0A485L590_9STRA|nr:hypothetical protein As57867_016219 [Aphanomyces stellatus]VFT93052.1 Aste57867_16276 [Aphanomyces stellatus]